MSDSAIPLGGEAFTLLAVLFVAGMLLIVLLRARSKARAARRTSRMDKSGQDSGYGADPSRDGPGPADGGSAG